MEARFVQEMHRFISQHTMIKDGETVLVAVSGGADSLALLYGLHTLQPQLNCHLHVIHLNHKLRHDSAADSEFVQEHAEQLGLSFTGKSVELPDLVKQWKLSTEAAGRKARYDFYESVCVQVGASKVALGHNQDDIAETVLMNLIRGTGTSGLKGILPIREDQYIRPLIRFTRKEIESFLQSINIVPRQDATNTDRRFLRNRIRHELVPLLEKEYNPNIKKGLNRTANVLGAESEYLDTITIEVFQECRLPLSQSTCIILDRETFLRNHIAVQRRVIRYSIAELYGRLDDFYFEHCQVILGLIHKDNPNTLLRLSEGNQFRRAYQQLIFERIPVDTEDFSYPLKVPGKTIIPTLNEEITTILHNIPPDELPTIPDGRYEVMLDYSNVQLPLIVRNRRQGDRFQPYGMKGTKKIKDFLIDAKVPRSERSRIPMIVCGPEILWVVGFTTNERYKVTANTQLCLHIIYARDESLSENSSDL